MQSVIYIDILFLINAILGYFILRATGFLCRCDCVTSRLIIAGIFAGFSSFIIFLPGLPGLAAWVYKISVCIFICSVAFKVSNLRMLFKRVFWYLLLNVALAGAVFAAVYYLNANGMHSDNLSVYFNVSPLVLILCVVAVYICVKLSGLLFGTPKERQVLQTSFFIQNVLCTCTALVDTGFSVKDLFGGKKVIMLSLPLMEKQLPAELYEDINAYFKGEAPRGKSLFFIVSVHTAGGFKALPAIKITKLKVKTDKATVTHENAAAVFTPEMLGANEFEAIIGCDIIG